MVTPAEWIQQNLGKVLGDTPQNQAQCVGAIESWLDALGLPHIWGNAIDLLQNADTTAYTIIKNSPTNSPSAGDIPVLGQPYGQSTDSTGAIIYLGHTGIATENCTVNILELAEQNDPEGSPLQIKQYDYSSVIGWIHPNILTPTVNQPVTDTTLQDQLNAEIQAVNACQSQLKEANQQISSLQASLTVANSQVKDLQTQVAELQTENIALTNASKVVNSKYAADEEEIKNLNAQIALQASSNKDYGVQNIDLSHQIEDLQGNMEKIAAGFDIKTTGLTYDQITAKILSEQEAEEKLAQNAHISLQILQELGTEVIEKVEELSPIQLGSRIMQWIRQKKYSAPASVGEGTVSPLQKFVKLFYTKNV